MKRNHRPGTLAAGSTTLDGMSTSALPEQGRYVEPLLAGAMGLFSPDTSLTL